MSCYQVPLYSSWSLGHRAASPVGPKGPAGGPERMEVPVSAVYVGTEETEYEALAALITLVAAHMLNVHPVTFHLVVRWLAGLAPTYSDASGCLALPPTAIHVLLPDYRATNTTLPLCHLRDNYRHFSRRGSDLV